jgi:hypothetical protein
MAGVVQKFLDKYASQRAVLEHEWKCAEGNVARQAAVDRLLEEFDDAMDAIRRGLGSLVEEGYTRCTPDFIDGEVERLANEGGDVERPQDSVRDEVQDHHK